MPRRSSRARSKPKVRRISTAHVLLQRVGKGKTTPPRIRVADTTMAGAVKRAQPIIKSASPKARFRFGTVRLDAQRPWFNKNQ